MQIDGMLSPEEQDTLTTLARDEYAGSGAIIDAGCFLGGSTAALAKGLRNNPRIAPGGPPRIHSYDLFRCEGDSWSESLSAPFGLTVGAGFRDRFEANIRPWADLVAVHEGDLLDAHWDASPVEILFLDICKSPRLHDRALELWFPHLIPGRSFLVQQDWGYRDYAYGNIAMEVLSDFFEVMAEVPYASRVYRCTAVPTNEAILDARFESIAPERRRTLLDRAIASTKREDFAAELTFSSALLAHEQGDRERVLRDLAAVFDRGNDSLSQAAHDSLGSYLVGPGPLGSPGWTRLPELRVISQMSADESGLLHAFTLARRPRRILEVGRARGGSTVVLADAAAALGGCVLVSLDPGTLPTHATNPLLAERLTARPDVHLVAGWSPHDYGRCAELAKGAFDLVFIDANHYYEAVIADLDGVIRILEPGAHILLHDAHFAGVRDGIRQVLSLHPELVDCGMVSTAANHDFRDIDYRGEPSVFGGIHLLRYEPAGTTIRPAVHRRGRFTAMRRRAGIAAVARRILRRIPGARAAVHFVRRLRRREQS